MESVIKAEMLKYARDHKLITKEQHGFLARKSTGTQLLDCVNDWIIGIRDKKCVDVYLDFQKAFDSVCHKKLLQKLEGYGICGFLLKWICAFLSNRKQRVVINDVCSEVCDVISGVPQGSVLCPLLFLLYVNDIVDCASDGVKIKLFADDVKLYVIYQKNENLEKSLLCNSLREIMSWSST